MRFESIRQARASLAVYVGVAFLAALSHSAFAAPGELAGAFAQLGAGRMESRTVTLADLGVRDTIVLRAPDAAQELYLPVPAGLPISNATLQLDANYLRGNGGRTTFLLSLDGSPVQARNVTEAQGDGSLSIGVDGAPRPSGFVRVGLQWSSVLNENVCTDQTAIGNVWKVAPTTRLTYQFDTSAVNDVRTAWSALPAKPVVLVSGGKLDASAYDVAWRLEALLMRGGASPVTTRMPAVGDTVNLGTLQVPAALQAVPAFAALAAGGSHKIANPAELGALIALAPAGAFAPNVVVADDALRAQAGAALDALRAQVLAVSADAASAFDAWRTHGGGALVAPFEKGELRLAHLGGLPTVVVGDDLGVSALSRTWSGIDASRRLVVHELAPSPNLSSGGSSDTIALSLIGGTPRTLDVLTSAAWEASFDLAAVSGDGRIPRRVVLDLAAAPAADRNGQTASVFFNGVLIGSQLLNTDGHAQRVSADIPVYALGTVNTLRVLFQRQPAGGCRPREQGYPAAVLPGSHLVLGTGPLGENFTGMVARFSRAANVIVPDAYLADPVTTLPRVARLANAAGVAPTRATLQVTAAGQAAQPKAPFFAADVALDSEAGHASFADGRLTLKGRGGSMLADISGLANLGLIQVVRSGSTPGIVYRGVGEAPVLPPGMQLLQGDVAIVDAGGVLKTFDTQYPGGVPPVDDQRAWLTRHWAGWGVPSIAITVLLLLLLAAGFARQRARARTAAAAAARAAQESANNQDERADGGADNKPGGS
ncbi:Cyclic di-GMP-binding protein [Paraburkholderia unamae]|uniref:cellulose biosynthesis cyclic di-GMP-binding regulatory protein BcsB n=1 Tax=Paraburkholderia unamae TaxID=219649 RepID=UPI001CABDA45|nr:cellulose biosynthesis cyclic di-GMP-binding regulatory protein BcsB [Paraburkholderia unamae]CAG9273265.1 Cyclic di-GMP-binding protein [Paraburkholderia unamae]